MHSPRSPWRSRGRVAWLCAAAAIATLDACGETSVSAPLPPARVDAVSAAAVGGSAGAALADPIQVRVFGSDNQSLPGIPVSFTVTGGSVEPTSATTDDNGLASTRWTLGTTAGQSTLTASAASGVAASITATVTSAAPANVSAAAGDAQTAAAGSAVPVDPSVRVVDAFGNLAADVPVTFSVLSGGGRVTEGVQRTDAQGVATVGSWVLGPGVGEQTLNARVEAGGVTDNPIVFTATASTPTGATMTAVAGNGQQASVGRLVPIAPSVVLRTAVGDPIPGAVVTFAIGSGGGGVVGSRETTDATGTATVGGWFLGPIPGANTLTASSPGVASVTFTATGVASTPVSMTAVSQVTQSASVGTNVSDPPSVIVRDAQGTPVQGVGVTFAVTAGGGSVAGSPVTTNASGVATLTSWTLGPALGTNTVVASATGLPSVTFNATGTAGVAATVAPFAGDNQVAIQGTQVSTAPSVRVLDASGNPVIGATVTFAVGTGGGTATGLSQLTNASGVAAVGSWTLGSGAPNTLIATVTGSGIVGNPVTFTAQSATTMAITAAPAGSVTLGAAFTISAQLRDSAGAVVTLPGIALTIEIASGGGTLGGTLVRVTDASGAVDFSGLTVSGAAGDRTFRVVGAGLTPVLTSAITFN